MRVIGLAGWSGAGKTTLLDRLIPALIARGLMVSTLKHAHHRFDIDRPGTDSWRHREAGANEVLTTTAGRWALTHESRNAVEPSVPVLLARMDPVDLVLIEGFKGENHPKIEIYRQANEKPAFHPGDRSIVAIAADIVFPGLAIPQRHLDDIQGIADVVQACALPVTGIDWRFGDQGKSGGTAF
jgi:molybdopterin-guanine dinucleotide biosynthesis adapter protein